MTKTNPKYSPEVGEWSVRTVLEHKNEHPSQWAAIESVAGKIGYSAQTLCNWVRQAERDQGKRPGAVLAASRHLPRPIDRAGDGWDTNSVAPSCVLVRKDRKCLKSLARRCSLSRPCAQG